MSTDTKSKLRSQHFWVNVRAHFRHYDSNINEQGINILGHVVNKYRGWNNVLNPGRLDGATTSVCLQLHSGRMNSFPNKVLKNPVCPLFGSFIT